MPVSDPKQPSSTPSNLLLDELTFCYEKAKAVRISGEAHNLLDALKSDDEWLSVEAADFMHKLGDKLEGLLIKDQRFPGSKALMVRGDSGAGGFYPSFISFSLIKKALELDSPRQAIEWLRKVLTTKYADGKVVSALWGVSVREKIQITPEVSLVPISMVPESQQKNWITDSKVLMGNSLVGSILNFSLPDSALMISRRIEPFLIEQDEKLDGSDEGYLKQMGLLRDITLLLTLFGPRVVIPAAQWFTYDDPDLEAACLLSAARRTHFEEVLPGRHQDYLPLEAEKISPLIAKYFSLEATTQDILRVALQRLNQSLRRHAVGDKAVELSIAFEALLGDGERNEMTYKILVRSTRLIGGENSTRKTNSALIKKMYEIRSSLVHTGLVKSSKKYDIGDQKMEASEVVNEAAKLCANLIQIIINRGGIPSWNIFDITENG